MSENESGGSDKGAVNPRFAKRRQDALGRGLEAMYQGVLNEPVPDDFLNILKGIDDNKPRQPSEPNGSGENAPAPAARNEDRG